MSFVRKFQLQHKVRQDSQDREAYRRLSGQSHPRIRQEWSEATHHILADTVKSLAKSVFLNAPGLGITQGRGQTTQTFLIMFVDAMNKQLPCILCPCTYLD